MRLLVLTVLVLWITSCTSKKSNDENSNNDQEEVVPEKADTIEEKQVTTNTDYEAEMFVTQPMTSVKSEEVTYPENLFPSFSSNKEAIERNWEKLEEGLYYLEAKGPLLCNIADSKIRILKIDPSYFSFHLTNAKEEKSALKKAPEWAKEKNYVALVNAGMFQFDGKGTNTAYMKNFGFFNNPRVGKDNAFVAFHSRTKEAPLYQIIDNRCQNFDSVQKDYHTVIQGIRMLDCNKSIVWSQQKKYWSTVCIGETDKGEALFCYTRSPFSVHDFIANIKALVPGVCNLMYLEGGPEASFYINHPKLKVAMMGSYETGFWEDDSNDRFWDIPNVIGIKQKFRE